MPDSTRRPPIVRSRIEQNGKGFVLFYFTDRSVMEPGFSSFESAVERLLEVARHEVSDDRG
jgi:hypothetical protein